MPAIGSIMTLAKEAGVDKKEAKAALVEHKDDYDAALASLKGTADDAGAVSTGAAESLSALSLAADEAENSVVSVVRMEVGDGETFPSYGDTLSVEYRGMLAEDGTEFDSSYAPSRAAHVPFTFRVGMGKVIRGWDEALPQISVGEKALIFVPACKAYGARGAPPKIPPNADLKFEVTLLKLTRQTSCLGGGQHGGVQRKTHEYAAVADQLLGRAPRTDLDLRTPDERQQMPLTSDMPA